MCSSDLETAWLLQRLPAVARVQPEEALLSAVARALGQWSGSERVAIDLEGHGREPVGDELEVSRTVGWFTALAPLLVDTRARRADGAALTLAKRARARLQALPQRGLPFMVGRALETAVSARLRALPKRQVSFNYLGQFDSLFADGTLFRPSTIAVGGDRDPQAPREYLLDISALIVDEQLRIAFSYGCNRHARPTIETLAARTVGFLRELIGAAQCGGATAWDAADFSDLQWNEDDAEAVLAAVQASLCEGDE